MYPLLSIKNIIDICGGHSACILAFKMAAGRREMGRINQLCIVGYIS